MNGPRWTALGRAALALPIAVAGIVVWSQVANRPLQAAAVVLVGLAFTAAASARPATATDFGPPGRSARDGRRRSRSRLAGALVVLAVAVAYFATLSPTTNATDSIEFQLVSKTLRIAHAPGYALYTLLGHAMTWLPVGDVAWRMNALSAYCGIVAAALAFALANRLANDPLAGVAAALALAFTPQLWSQAVITEVYTLNVALVLGVLACLAQLRRRHAPGRTAAHVTRASLSRGRNPDATWRLSALTLAGLGFTHHLTTVFLYPVVAWLVLVRDPMLLARPRDVARSAFAFIVGLTPLLYFPWRWRSVNGTALDVPTLFGYVTGRNYPGLFDLGRLPDEPARWVLLRHALLAAFGPWTLVLAAVGLAALLARRRFDWAVALVAITGAYAVFYLGYFAWDGWVVLLPALAALAIAAGVGAASAATPGAPLAGSRQVSTLRRGFVAALCAGATSASLAHTWPRVDASRGWPGQVAADRALAEPIPYGAVLVVDPSVGAGFLYARHLKGVRPDLEVAYADWPAGRRALTDPLAEDRPVVAYGIAREALPSAGVRAVPIGPSYALLPSSRDDMPAGLTAPQPALLELDAVRGVRGGREGAAANDTHAVIGWRAIPSPARAGGERTLPGDDVNVQLAWRGGAGALRIGEVRVRLISPETGQPVSSAASKVAPQFDGHVTTADVQLHLARELAPGTYVLESALVQSADASHTDSGAAVDDSAWRPLGGMTISPLTRRDVADEPAFRDVRPVRRTWPDGTTLVGIEAPATVGVGAALDVRAYWTHPSTAPARGGLVRLVDPWTGAPSDGAVELPSGPWPGGPDAVRVTRHSLLVTPDATCGRGATVRGVRCALGLLPFAPALVRDGDGTAGTPFGRPWRLPRVAIRSETPGLDTPQRFESGVAVLGFQPRRRIVRPGAWLAVDTLWSAGDAPPERDKAFVQILDAHQALRGSSDREILYGAEPMDEWRSGEVVADTFFVRVPADMPPGPAVLQLGLYDRDTLERRAVLAADGSKGDDRVMTGIYIMDAARDPSTNHNFAAVDFAAVDVAFDGGPRLIGIAAPSPERLRSGDAVTITLRWRVDTSIAGDWTAFLHLLRDPSGTEPVAQSDGPPLGPLFPTRLWPLGAALDSTHVLIWPDDPPAAQNHAAWLLAIGLYDATTLERAPLRGHAAGGAVDGAGRAVRWPLVPGPADADSATTSP